AEIVLVPSVLDEVFETERERSRRVLAQKVALVRELNRLEWNAPLDLLDHHLDELLAIFVLPRHAVDRAPKCAVEPTSCEVVITVLLNHLERTKAVDWVGLARNTAVLVAIVADKLPWCHLLRI